ncbi:MAG: tryptophan 2,3-dioxygenase [Gemmatimonadetes bacterium]|nr:MAG: tryptophan 2,3-dioxygenase [Gemmatimonadota bacterium]
MDEALTYGRYLRIHDLLSLQEPRSEGPEHDEMLFIVIHQVYELWFKEVLHELDYVVRMLAADDPVRAQHTLKRVLTILKVLVAQLDVLETMTPLEFLSFRERLEAASGFQSHQFRELEALLGRKRADVAGRFPEGSPGRRNLERRYHEPTLWDAFLGHLARRGCAVPAHALERDVTRPVEPDEAVQDVLVEVYRSDPATSLLCERLVDLDEGLQEWRYRHMKMVERTIGSKRGTGGSAGSTYLRTTLDSAVFPDLWAIRSRL